MTQGQILITNPPVLYNTIPLTWEQFDFLGGAYIAKKCGVLLSLCDVDALSVPKIRVGD